MSDPKRFLTDSNDDLGALLLRAGRARPPPGAKERALLLASGAAAATTLTAATGAAAEGTAAGVAKAGSLVAIKWIGVLGVTGVSAVAGAVALQSRALEAHPHAVVAAASAPAATGRRQLAPPARAAPAPPAGEPLGARATDVTAATAAASPPEPAPHAGRAATAASERAAPRSSTTPAELALLDEARAALDAGEAARALEILDRYASRFRHGAMGPEATVLRVEALLAKGEAGAADHVADAFLAREPASPYAARLRTLRAAHNP